MLQRYAIFAIALSFFALPLAAATATTTAPVTVNASNSGAFSLTIKTTVGNSTTYNFGIVDSAGTANGGSPTELLTVANGGITTGSGWAEYTSKTTGMIWEAQSAPGRTVRLWNSSTPPTPDLTNWASGTNLWMSASAAMTGNGGLIPGTGCGFVAMSANLDGGDACSGATLAYGIAAGKGSNVRTGTFQLRIRVADGDITGAATWPVVVTAFAP